ncbi:SWIM zinc finger family protein [Lachnospiraceae bacterium 38-10]
MADWKKQLAEIDDEYLIGLTNKGIVKRAYKDKETAVIKILKLEEEAALQIDGETVILSLPLGDSKCSCPSRSICKHIISGILFLKEQTACSDEDAEDITSEENTDSTDKRETLWNEILSFPEKDLLKVMGTRRLASFLTKVGKEVRPEIEESSVFTIQLPGENITVKLLSPLEYSSCSCHKKELCVHKAEAILWCRLKAGVFSLKDLEEFQKKDSPLDTVQIKNAAVQMKDYLEELMTTGLSRVSPDVTDSLERFAIISHNAGLADFERAFRGLGTLYQSYLSRQASFLTVDLMKKLTGLYSRVNILLDTEDIALLLKEAGEFHADYLAAGDLDLTGITIEHFEDVSGYEGETVYFLETKTDKWYTYTVARPVFYDKRKKWGKPQKAEAPWGLNCSLENLITLRIHLMDAKCDERRRLSSSKETRGEILGTCEPDPEEFPRWYYEDFGKLFSERITGQNRDLVFIQPAFCEKAVFSKTEQMLSMTLYDRQKREVILELPYSKEDARSIRYLEKIREEEPPCFIGKVYLRDGRIRFIPVDTWK